MAMVSQSEGIAKPKRLEDFYVGQKLVTPGRTIEASDISFFAGLTGDFYPLHMDEEHARQTRFGGRIAHGPLTFSVAVGLAGLSGFYGDAVEALLGVDELRAHRPVHPGDTIRVHLEVIAIEPVSKPGLGSMRLSYSVINQHEEQVMSFLFSVLARFREVANG